MPWHESVRGWGQGVCSWICATEPANTNPEDKFSLLFSGVLETLFIERMEQNEEIFARFMNEQDFKRVVAEWAAIAVYSRLRRQSEGGTDAGAD